MRLLILEDSQVQQLSLFHAIRNRHPDIELVIAPNLESGLRHAETVDAAVLDVKLPDNETVKGLSPIIEALNRRQAPWVIYSVTTEKHENVIPKGRLGDLMGRISGWKQAFEMARS